MSETEGTGAAGISNKDVAKGAGTTLLARMGGVLDAITQPLYIWMFGLAGAGFYGALWEAIDLVENSANMGMTGAMQRVVPQARTRQEEAAALRAALILGVTPSILIAALVTMAAAPVASLFNANASDTAIAVEIVSLFVWALPLWALVEVATSALRAKRVFGAEIRLRLLWEQVIRLVIVIALYIAGFGTRSLFIAHLVSLAIVALLSIRMLTRHFDLALMLRGPLFDPVFSSTLKTGLSVLPAGIVMRLFSSGPAIALNMLIPGGQGAIATSLYIIARKISSIVQLVRTAFAYVLAPLASAASTQGASQVRSIYGYSTRLSLALALPLGTVLAAMGPAMLPLFGPGADAALLALVILTFARVAEAIFGAAMPIQQVTGGYVGQQAGSVLGVAAAALIAFTLMPAPGAVHEAQDGLFAMAVAVGIGQIVAALLPLFQLHVFDRLHPFEAPFGRVAARVALVTLIGAAAALLLQLLPPVGQRIALMLVILGAWRLSWKLAAFGVVIGGAEWIAVQYLPGADRILPHLMLLSLLLPVLVATLWGALRFGLTDEDRVTLGKKTVKRFRLG